ITPVFYTGGTMRNVKRLNSFTLAQAAAAGAPSCAGIFSFVQQSSAPPPFAKANPKPPNPPTTIRAAVAPSVPLHPSPTTKTSKSNPIHRAAGAPQSSGTFNNVQQSSSPSPKRETNPPTALTPRQVAAARLLVLGRTNRAAASELDVEE